MKPEILAKRLGRIVRRLRQYREMTQEDLVTATGISQPMISHIEKGQANRINLFRVITLAKGLGMKGHELLKMVEEPQEADDLRRLLLSLDQDEGSG